MPMQWQGDFTLQRFRATLAKKHLMHPDLEPAYMERYRPDLGESSIVRRPLSASASALDNNVSPGNTWRLRTSASLSASGGLGKSSSVPSLGVRRADCAPASTTPSPGFPGGRQGLPKGPHAASTGSLRIAEPASPTAASDDPKAREKEMNVEAWNRKLWTSMKSAEYLIQQYLILARDDPANATSLRNVLLPGVQKALSQGAKLDWQNDEWDGATLIIKFARTGCLEAVMWLLERGADHTIVDYSGRGVLHWAAMDGRGDLVEFLLQNVLQRGLKIDDPDGGGDSPLHLAAYHGNLSAVRLLVRHGADPLLQNQNGYTAVELASVRRKWHVANYLSDFRLHEQDKAKDKEAKDETKYRLNEFVRVCDASRATRLRQVAPPPKKKADPKKKPK